MLNKASDDLYVYLKGRRWGWPIIGLICTLVLGFVVWGALTQAQREAIFGGTQASNQADTVKESEDSVSWRNLTYVNCPNSPTGSPRQEYEVANSLSNAIERDIEFSTIVVSAFCAKDEGLANEILSRMLMPEWKDQAIRQIIQHHVSIGDVPSAQRWIDRLSNATDRDWWRKTALEQSRKGASQVIYPK